MPRPSPLPGSLDSSLTVREPRQETPPLIVGYLRQGLGGVTCGFRFLGNVLLAGFEMHWGRPNSCSNRTSRLTSLSTAPCLLAGSDRHPVSHPRLGYGPPEDAQAHRTGRHEGIMARTNPPPPGHVNATLRLFPLPCVLIDMHARSLHSASSRLRLRGTFCARGGIARCIHRDRSSPPS